MMRVAVTGSSGLLGRSLVRHLCNAGVEVCAFDHSTDICGSLTRWLRGVDVCIHCAAIADVARCEANPDEAWRVNVTGVRNVVRHCRRLGVRLVYISTDAVFQGAPRTWYGESAPPRPLQVYGRTKALAEREVGYATGSAVVRLPLLFGAGPRATFPEVVARALLAGRQVLVNARDTRQPVLVDDVALCLAQLIEKNTHGIVHVAPRGATTKWHWARHIAGLIGADAHRVLAEPEGIGGPRRPVHACLAADRIAQLGITRPRSYDVTTRWFLRSRGFTLESRTAAA